MSKSRFGVITGGVLCFAMFMGLFQFSLNFVFTPTATEAAVTGFVQAASVSRYPGSSSISAVFTSNTTPGNAIVGYVYWTSTTINLNSVTGCGNTYNLINNPTNGTNRAAGFYSTNITGGACTVTANFSADAGNMRILMHEVAGIATTNAFDGSSLQFQSLSPGSVVNGLSSNSITTTVSGDYIFGATSSNSNNGTVTASSGFTPRLSVGSVGLTTEDLTQTNAGPIAATFSRNTTSYVDFHTLIIALKPAVQAPPDTTAPSTPANLTATTLSSSRIDLAWSSSTDNVAVSGYKLYRDGTLITTTTATSFSNTGLTPSTAYTYSVLAFDAAGNNSVLSQTATATTADPSFDFTITNEGNKSVVQGSSIVNNLTTNLTSGATKVLSFSVTGLPSGATAVFNPTTCSPTCSTAMNIDTLPETAIGNYPITVTASDGALSHTTAFTLSVTGIPDNTFPTVSISAPDGTAPLIGSVTVSAEASDNIGVVGVQFKLDGNNLNAEDTTSPYAITWDTTTTLNTTHTLTAIARDAWGNITTSTPVSVSVNNPPPPGNIINAANCSSTSVRNAVNAAADGDTVVVPAGNCTWTTPAGSTPVISINRKAITLKGAGMDQTNINLSIGSSWNEDGIRIDGIKGKDFRITGFTFSGGSASTKMISVYGDAKNFRIDHNKFTSSLFLVSTYTEGATYGVIDHNNYFNTRPFVVDDGDGSWSRPLNLGSAEAVYFEDNTMHYTVYSAAIGSGFGSRYVFRHNTVINSGLEAEGACSGEGRGSRSVEIYDNTLTGTGEGTYEPFVPVYIRSGTGVVFNNTVTGVWNNQWTLVDNQRSDGASCGGVWASHPRCDGSGPYDGNTPGMNGYLCRDQIGASTDNGLTTPQSRDPLYSWNNTGDSGSVDIVVAGGPGSAQAIQLNRDYFNSTPKPGYTPYIYPHPLVTPPPPDTQAPVVTITSPVSNSDVIGDVTLTANATDNLGIASVQFLLDGVNFGSQITSYPYSIVWSSSSAALGSHTISAQARDAAGNVGVATDVVVNVVADTTAPTISNITVTNLTFTNATINWTTNELSDSQVVFVNGPCPNTTDCTTSLNSTMVTSHGVPVTNLLAFTTYNYTVTSKDAAGNTTTSLQQSFTTPKDTTLPTVSLTAPANNATVTGVALTVSANASDNYGIAGVQFKLDGVNLGTEDTSSPYSVSWNTTTTTNGTHTLTATAKDKAGNLATSTSRTVTVNNDLTAPTVSFTAPSNNASVVGTINVNATASDNVKVIGVQFKLDGVNLGTEDTSSPYSVSWNTTTTTNGTHTLSATARDAAGNTKTSTITVIVANPIIYFPTNITTSVGTYVSGNAASLTTDDNNFYVVSSTTTGTNRLTTTDFETTGVAAGSKLDYTVRLKSSVSSTAVTISAFNYTTSVWTTLSAPSIGTAETAVTASISTNAANYISPDGKTLVRVQSTKNANHTLSHELYKIVVTP